jgi:peptidoglycan/xylan/chitin deacetylase (PgdA/CDA1 family)
VAVLKRICGLTITVLALCASGARAEPCANPNALGVSRTITVDARRTPMVGSHDYGLTLPLAPREVVLTFDDGPRPPYTNQVLKALADECLHATFFLLGRQARANPGMVRQVQAAGHTIATHTQNHPMHRMSLPRARQEIETGIASVGNALGSTRSVAPFFRFPGLYRTSAIESYLRSRGLMAWSIDIDSYDYRRTSGTYMLRRVLDNLEQRRGGILLMHDIQPKTATMLPTLLANLKKRGFRVVHVVPAVRDAAPPDLVASAAPTVQVAQTASRTKARRHKRVRAVVERATSAGTFETVFTSSVMR